MAVIINSNRPENIGKVVTVGMFYPKGERTTVDLWQVSGDDLLGFDGTFGNPQRDTKLFIVEKRLLRIDDYQEDKADEREKSHESA